MSRNPMLNGKAIITIAVVSAITTAAMSRLAAARKVG